MSWVAGAIRFKCTQGEIVKGEVSKTSQYHTETINFQNTYQPDIPELCCEGGKNYHYASKMVVLWASKELPAKLRVAPSQFKGLPLNGIVLSLPEGQGDTLRCLLKLVCIKCIPVNGSWQHPSRVSLW